MTYLVGISSFSCVGWATHTCVLSLVLVTPLTAHNRYGPGPVFNMEGPVIDDTGMLTSIWHNACNSCITLIVVLTDNVSAVTVQSPVIVQATQLRQSPRYPSGCCCIQVRYTAPLCGQTVTLCAIMKSLLRIPSSVPNLPQQSPILLPSLQG